ncbi:MAG: hypothetical protein ACI4EK_04340 [Wujia sp.]
MSKSNIKILLFLAAVAILGLTYLYVFKTNMDDAEALQSEVNQLQTRYDELKEKEKDRDYYVEETENYNKKFEERLAYFPAGLNQEVSVMFMKGVEKDQGNLQFGINSFGMSKPEGFYSLAGDEYQCYKANFPIVYQGSYEGLKDFVDYVMNYQYRMNIDTFNIAYNAQDDTYTGAINLNAYCIEGGERTPETVDIDVPEGVSNIFLGGNTAATVTSSSHDGDLGASIKDDHAMVIGLNNANGDGSEGVVVTAGSNSVKNSDNSIQTVDLSIKEEDGKNMVECKLGGDSYSFELTDSELKIYVESSKRVDSDDKNGIKLNVANETDVPVFVKVADDDASAPRFALGSKTGTVKVY